MCEFPTEFPATVVVVLHLQASSPRYLAKILGDHTQVKVSNAAQDDELLSSRIFVAPPSAHQVVRPNYCFGLDHVPKVKFTCPAADCLFSSAAQVIGPQVLGVVLTGGDGDGSQGLKEIKKHGGRSVVQRPADAEAPSMRITAIVHNSPDYVAMLDEMGPLLRRLVNADTSRQGHQAAS